MRELTPIETNPAVRLIKNVQETGNKKSWFEIKLINTILITLSTYT